MASTITPTETLAGANGPQPASQMVTMFAPDGSTGQIPQENVNAAVAAGGKIAVSFVAPSGEKGYIPMDRVHDAIKAGGRIDDPVIGALSNANPKMPGLQKTGSAMDEAARISTDPIGVVGDALDSIRNEIGNYTPAGRAEHPILSRIGDVLQSANELLSGAQSSGKPMGTSAGVLNNPVTTAVAAAPGAADAAGLAEEKLAQAIQGVKAARAAKTAEAAAKVSEVNPEQFIYKESGPAPQHGTPVTVASPLDNATINKLPGGKDLTPEAIEALKEHIGGEPGKEIEVGSTPKNTLLKAVEPVQKTIAETGAKMRELVENAPQFKTAISEDNFDQSGEWTKHSIEKSIDDLRENLPGGDEEHLNKTVEKELQSAHDALNSRDPNEVLAYRRKVGSQVDWNNVAKNPETPGEVQNATKARIYKALTDKLHREIPGITELDKIFQPNLELQSHLDAKLGTTISRNPAEAKVQGASEMAKGKRQLDVDAYNEIIRKNRQLAGLPKSDVEPSIKPTTQQTPIDQATNQAVSKFKAPASEQDALKQLLQPSVKAGKVFGTNTSWYDALKSFDELTPEERAARFSDPNAIRKVLSEQAKAQVAKSLVKWGSVAAVAHALGVDRAILRSILAGEG